MDGVSAAASIIAIWQITEEIVGFAKDFIKAPEEYKKLASELRSIQFVLQRLKAREEDAQKRPGTTYSHPPKVWSQLTPPRTTTTRSSALTRSNSTTMRPILAEISANRPRGGELSKETRVVIIAAVEAEKSPAEVAR